MLSLIDTLAAELERPRELTVRVTNYICGTYDVTADTVDEFLESRLPSLEDDEHDLILSPLFTPRLDDQTVFANLLGQSAVSKTEWPALIQQLAQRPTQAQLIAIDGKTHKIKLREVILERYVYRLRLEGEIPESLFGLLADDTFAADRSVMKAVARRAVWESAARRDILLHYLTTLAAITGSRRHTYNPGDVLALLRLMEDYKPADIAHLLERIPHWQEALRQDIEAGDGPKPFFSGGVQASHGGERDHRRPDDISVAAKKEKLAFLVRLNQLLID